MSSQRRETNLVKPEEALAATIEISKNFSGAASLIVQLVDYLHPIIPVNEGLRAEWWPSAAVLAMVAGFGAHQYAKRSDRLILGWIFLVLAVATMMVLFWLADDPRVMSPWTIRSIAHDAYVLFFLFLGGAVGGFMRAEDNKPQPASSN